MVEFNSCTTLSSRFGSDFRVKRTILGSAGTQAYGFTARPRDRTTPSLVGSGEGSLHTEHISLQSDSCVAQSDHCQSHLDNAFNTKMQGRTFLHIQLSQTDWGLSSDRRDA